MPTGMAATSAGIGSSPPVPRVPLPPRPPPPPMLWAKMPSDNSPWVRIVPLLVTSTAPPSLAPPPMPPTETWKLKLRAALSGVVQTTGMVQAAATCSEMVLELPPAPPPPPTDCAKMPCACAAHRHRQIDGAALGLRGILGSDAHHGGDGGAAGAAAAADRLRHQRRRL